jgi:hypothetical protein
MRSRNWASDIDIGKPWTEGTLLDKNSSRLMAFLIAVTIMSGCILQGCGSKSDSNNTGQDTSMAKQKVDR